jgi:hypothetical protein
LLGENALGEAGMRKKPPSLMIVEKSQKIAETGNLQFEIIRYY